MKKNQTTYKSLLSFGTVFLFLSSSLSYYACKRTGKPEDAPSCIQEKIKDIASVPVRNPPAKIWQYRYNGQTVYYIPPYCCDFPGELFDENCNLICQPDGGITGNGDGRCTDFAKKGWDKKLIWEDKR